MDWTRTAVIAQTLLAVLTHGRDLNAESSYTETYTYRDTHFMFFSERLTWDEALVICPSYRSRLAVVDDADKAGFLAQSMAYTNMEFEDMWIGGVQENGVWQWESTRTIVENVTNKDGYPPWVRTKFRRGKNCLAMDRRLHDKPLFADLNCKLLRPFMCEKSSGVETGTPMPVKWERVGDSLFILYHGRVTWIEAASFCRHHGYRLAVVDSHEATLVIGAAMTVSRPDFDHVWVGARASRGSFSWLATGDLLSEVTDPSTLYPPWRDKVTYYPGSCVLMDRHNCTYPVFLVEKCNRKRHFVCEEVPSASEKPSVESLRFYFGSSALTLYVREETWTGAEDQCKNFGGKLVTLTDPELLTTILDAMADHPAAVKHVWVGGVLKDGKWAWSSSQQAIPSKNKEGFPPWCGNNTSPDRSCLNLDRSSHVDPTVYGLDCSIKQPFVCKTDCSPLGDIRHGQWSCRAGEGGKQQVCQLNCKKPHVSTGSTKYTCTEKDGWLGEHGEMEFPLCKVPHITMAPPSAMEADQVTSHNRKKRMINDEMVTEGYTNENQNENKTKIISKKDPQSSKKPNGFRMSQKQTLTRSTEYLVAEELKTTSLAPNVEVEMVSKLWVPNVTSMERTIVTETTEPLVVTVREKMQGSGLQENAVTEQRSEPGDRSGSGTMSHDVTASHSIDITATKATPSVAFTTIDTTKKKNKKKVANVSMDEIPEMSSR